MAGLIVREDIDEVRSRVRIDDVVGEYVTLRSAGVDSMKGLCPFHDEKTPSFHVRPSSGYYHCFGCGESGDAYTFLQKMDGCTFTEAVERMAERAGMQLRYEKGSGPDRREAGQRARLFEAHKEAQDFFRANIRSPEAEKARRYMAERGFDEDALTSFGVGYAPRGWDNLSKHLRSRGFLDKELTAGGLAAEGRRGGVYDRFRGRLIWPIRDVTGRVIGFGARKLYDDDEGPKYLNTPETPLYRKNQVLYGLDRAKRAIAKDGRAVVVEGYTDVMAAHLAGIDCAVATCGTAFGAEHTKIIRRLMGDAASKTGEVIFTFDGDEAGQQAALRAFREDSEFTADTFVAVERSGLDPADIRLQKGDGALRDLIESRRPLFEFALSKAIADYDLDTVEGRVKALREAAPIVAAIRDRGMRPGYERWLSGRLGMTFDEIRDAVQRAAAANRPSAQPGRDQQNRGWQQQAPRGGGQQAGSYSGHQRGYAEDPDARIASDVESYQREIGGTEQDSTGFRIERGALQVALQKPDFINVRLFDRLKPEAFNDPGSRAVFQAMQAAGGMAWAVQNPQNWPERVIENADERAKQIVAELVVRALPAQKEDEVERYCRSIVARLFDKDIVRIAGLLHSQLLRTDPSDVETSAKLLEQLQVLERQRARLRQHM